MTKESHRDQRGPPILDATAQDLRYAFRGIRRNPGFATIAILSLAIGIGANTAIVSLVNAVLLQPLAYKDPQRVFAVGEFLPQLLGQNPIVVNAMHARDKQQPWTCCGGLSAVSACCAAQIVRAYLRFASSAGS